MTTDVWADMYYTNFSPNGAPTLPYYLRRQDWTYCYDPIFLGGSLGGMMAYSDALAIQAASSVTAYAIDLYVDVMFLTGRILIGNPGGSLVPIGDTTEYTIAPVDGDTVNQLQYDFDGDGKPDRSVLGNLFEEAQSDGSTLSVFRAEPDAAGKYTLQGVYFSSRTDQSGAPDVIRQADNAKELGHNGLLSSISEDDFKNTDILVFRESTGQLVMERRGLRDAEIDGRAQIGMGQGDDNVFYRIMLRGPKDSNINVGGTNRAGNWNEWATRNQLEEPFSKQDGDHLRPGEWIRLVVINRATGYMGTQRIQLSDASKNPGGFLNVPVEDIVMRPPNLKIWAERTYQVEHGLSANGEDRRFLIGAEGAGLVNDAMIEVYSEWYDHDGRPLPEGLGAGDGEDYGLSGRLAKVVSTNYIDADSDSAIFPIGPGRQTQLLKIRDNLTVPEHFYIHVSGTQKDENPQFDAAGNAALEPFDSRPRTLTPFQVPVYDENKDWKTYNAYRDLLREQAEAETPDPDAVTPQKPLPSYVWSYRPEYQFSQYDLEIAEINRVNLNEQGEEEKENILDLSTPVISSGDQLIEFLYSLTGSTGGLLDRLSPIDGPQDLVLALGEEEVKLTLGQNQQIRIENIEHLASLSPEDFLTMRLYVNQDAGNILWEYAFATLSMYPSHSSESPVLDLSADETQGMTFVATYANVPDEPIRINWGSSGSQSVFFSPIAETSATGVFSTNANLPTQSNSVVRVFASDISYSNSKFYAPAYKIIPGQPAQLTVERSGETTISGFGSVNLSIRVRDQYGNDVSDGTPVHIESTDLIVDGDNLTSNGLVNVAVRGSFMPGNQNLIISSGNVSRTEVIDVHDIALNVTMPAQVEIGETVPLTVTATSTYGDLNGLSVDISGIRAAMDKNTYILGEGNSVTLDAYVGDFVGEGRIFASISDKIQRHDFTVVDSSPVQLLDNVIVAGMSGKSAFEVDGAVYEYTGETAAVVTGSPGEILNVSLMDYLAPPMLPELLFPLQRNSSNGEVQDEMIGFVGDINQAARIPSYFEQLQYAYDFKEQSYLTLDYDRLVDIANLGVVFNFKPTASGKLLTYQGLGLELSLNASNQLTYKRVEGDNTVEVTTAELAINQWHKVGVHFINGQLIIQVDEEVYKSADILPAAQVIPNHSLTVGAGAEGHLANIAIYDWNAAKITTFADGSLEGNVTIGTNGKGVIGLRSGSTLAFADVTRRKFDYWQSQQPGMNILEVAYAAEENCAPINPLSLDSFDQLIHIGAEYSRHMAECNYLPRIKKTFITIQSDTSKWRKALAIAELSYYVTQYTNHKKAELALTLGPQCIEGAITGNVENVASGTCDIITSFFLIGDLRDFILHSKYQYWDEDFEKFDYPIYVFSGLGIVASLASVAGGIGIPANVALAGMKTGAKVMKGPYMGAIAKHFYTEIGGNFNDFDRIMDTLRTSLPLLQITAAGIMFKEEFALAYNAIANIKAEQLIGIMQYYKISLQRLEADVLAVNHQQSDAHNWLAVAYAIDKDALIKLLGGSDEAAAALKKLLQAMQDTQQRFAGGQLVGAKGKNAVEEEAFIMEIFNDGLSQLGKHVNDTDTAEVILENIGNDRFLKAMLVAQDMAGIEKSQGIVDALRRFRCIPGDCTMGGLPRGKEGMLKFFDFFEDIADARVAGKVDDETWGSLSKVIASMGQIPSDAASVTRVERTARGATEAFAQIALDLQDETVEALVAVERKVDIEVAGKKIGAHIFDYEIRTAGKIIKKEVKDWEESKLVEYLWMSFRGKAAADGSQTGPQFFLDVVELLKKGAHDNLDNIDIQWVFSKGNPEEIVASFLNKIDSNRDALKSAMIASNNPSLVDLVSSRSADRFDSFVDEELKLLMNKIIVSGKRAQ